MNWLYLACWGWIHHKRKTETLARDAQNTYTRTYESLPITKMHQVNLNYCLCWHSEITLAHVISLKDGERQWVTETEGVSEWERMKYNVNRVMLRQ